MTEPRWDLIHDAVITDDEPDGCRHSGACLIGHTFWGEEVCVAAHIDALDEPDVTGSDCA